MILLPKNNVIASENQASKVSSVFIIGKIDNPYKCCIKLSRHINYNEEQVHST